MPRKPKHAYADDPATTGTRERLLDAALAEFTENGLRASKIASICRRAKLANGTFYLHFRTKDDVYRELIARAAADLARRLSAAHRAGSDVRELDRVEVAIIVDFAEEQEELFQLAWRERGAYAIAHETFADLLVAQRSGVIADGQAKGTFRDELVPHIAAVADLGVTGELVEWWLADRTRCTKAALIDQLTDLRARMFFP